MRKIEDYGYHMLGELIGAVCHHAHFLSDEKSLREISEGADFIRQKGHGPYISREYPNPEEKGIIISRIEDQLYVTDGNKHCVALVTASPKITIGDLLEASPKLIRYWEDGVEEGGDAAHMPYVTYIPIAADVSRIPEARQGTDDKGNAINIIPSNIQYDSELFSENDRGRFIRETAYTIEAEAVYLSFAERVNKAKMLSRVLGYCAQMYELISHLNMDYGYVEPGEGYDHEQIWQIASRVQEMPIENPVLAAEVHGMTKEVFAGHMFNSIDGWMRG